MADYLDAYLNTDPKKSTKTSTTPKASGGTTVKGNMEEFTKILSKKVEASKDTVKSRAEVYLKSADRSDVIHILKGLYTMYACPADKDAFDKRVKEWKLTEDDKDSNAYKKLMSGSKRLETTYEKLGVKGNMTYLGWAKALKPYVTANEGIYDNLLICAIPIHTSLLYCKGFWASLPIKSAIQLYDTWTKRSEPLAFRVFKDSEGTFYALHKLKEAWTEEFLLSACEAGTKVKDKAWNNIYFPAIFHILDPMMLWMSYEWADTELKSRDKLIENVRTRVTVFIENWGPKGQTFKEMNQAAKKRYHEKIIKPVMKLAALIRRPTWYDPRAAAKGPAKSLRENFSLGGNIQGTREEDLFDPEPKKGVKGKKPATKEEKEPLSDAKQEEVDEEVEKTKASEEVDDEDGNDVVPEIDV